MWLRFGIWVGCLGLERHRRVSSSIVGQQGLYPRNLRIAPSPSNLVAASEQRLNWGGGRCRSSPLPGTAATTSIGARCEPDSRRVGVRRHDVEELILEQRCGRPAGCGVEQPDL